MPIRSRLATVFSVATAVLVALGAVIFVTQLRWSLNTSVNADLRARANAIQTSIGHNNPTTELQDGSPAALAPSEPLAQILAPDGTVLAAAGTAGTRPVLTPTQIARAHHSPLRLTTRLPGFKADTRLYAVTVRGQQPGEVAVVGTSLDATEDAVSRVKTLLLVAGIPIVAVAAVGAWMLAGAALKPVERMRRQAASISEHELGTGLDVPATGDEIAALARTMNELLARLHTALARERGFVADAGHELRTPLAILRTELELANRPGRTQDELVLAVREAADETERLARLAEDLLSLARTDQGPESLQRTSTDLAAVVADSVRAASARATDLDVEVTAESPPELRADVDPGSIRRAIDNLVDNALRFAPRDSTVRVTLGAPNGIAVVEVLDEGPGFPIEFLPLAFERFGRSDHARARADGGGAGLGLAIVQSIARAHGGRAIADNRSTGGAAVRVEIPLHGPTDALHRHRLHISNTSSIPDDP